MRDAAFIFLGLMSIASSARGQVHFASVAAARGLVHSNPYNQTFLFPVDRWGAAASVLAMMQANLGNGAGVGDFDRDGDLDVYLLNQLGLPNHFFRNDLTPGGPRFSAITSALGLGDLGLGRLAMFADFDNDGWQELLLLNDDEPDGLNPASRLFRNVGGRFEDVTDGSGLAPIGYIRGGACLGDYDQDGLLDVYMGLWLYQSSRPTPLFPGYNHLFRNVGGLRFEDVTLSSGLGVFAHDSFSCVFADFDNDGDSDLYVAVDHTSDVYYRNDGGTFANDTSAVGATHTGNDMGIAVADFDDDGDLDVYSTNITDPTGPFGTTDYNTLLVNQLAETGVMRFVDEAGARGMRETYWGWGTEFVDVDNDGDLDLYAVNGFDQFVASGSPALVDTPEVMFVNDGAGRFMRAVGCGADFVGDARAAVALDYDLDGDQDFLVTNTNEATVLLENQSEGQGHFLDVRLVGRCGFNADAVGARVYVTVGAWTRMREVIAGGSYLAGRPLSLHFGLGSVTSVDSLRVVWPDGSEAEFADVVADRRWVVMHGGGLSPEVDLARSLREFADFQRCFGREAGCERFDFIAPLGVGDEEVPGFVASMRWPVAGCAPPE